ncbi:adenosine kinase [Maritimibacter sp. 55A14]|uniref:adenosine kinase n=1 Tax=Maritimibacter sp. 55A14 TaxID=2174844 RepID=UPI000D6170D3|nr:adenosine kinase [Maritimibacter sp. 55A14]PWE32242.1 adenosine kinase [Maritimibacter sp. 55A14]
MTKKYQVVGIGNALVDVLCHTDDAFLTENGIGKGTMQLIDRNRAVDLYGRMGPSVEVSGGSAANTIAGIAALGGRTAYVGKVKDDQLGAIFAHDLRAQGADYAVPPAPQDAGAETGRCMVLVTPDGERSMSTYLGVSEHLGPEDIDATMMAEAEWLYLEGYRFDGPESHAAFERAIASCRSAGGKVALTLSDPFCIQRHRDAFRRMIVDDLDLLFCNRAEMLEIYGTPDLDAALGQAAREVETVVCTDSENGAHVLAGGERWLAPAVPTQIVDATGAGDLFAAGFLWGVTHGHGPMTAAEMGNVAASEVIGHIGARPEADLMQLYRTHGLV